MGGNGSDHDLASPPKDNYLCPIRRVRQGRIADEACNSGPDFELEASAPNNLEADDPFELELEFPHNLEDSGLIGAL
jgi:hypothetical protein